MATSVTAIAPIWSKLKEIIKILAQNKIKTEIIYINSTPELRSSTFSLLTIAIGCGALGSLNIYLMSAFFSTEEISNIMAIEGLLVGLVFIIIALVRFPSSKFFEK